MALGLLTGIKTSLLNRKWRKANRHNQSYIQAPCNISLITVGKGTYGPIRAIHTGKQGNLTIGNWCSIAPDVAFVFNNEHELGNMTTYPFKARILDSGNIEARSKGGIVVKDDVWLGCRSTILDGVTIEQGAVIAAGALVASDIPPYAIAGGVPAKIIKYRFSEDTIRVLERVNLGLLDKDSINSLLEELYTPVDYSIARMFARALPFDEL